MISNFRHQNLIANIAAGFLLLVISSGSHAGERFPYGIFDKSDPYGKFEDTTTPLAGTDEWRQYRHNLTGIYKRYNINTIINTPYRNDSHARYVLDELHANDIQVIFQPAHPFNRKTSVSEPGYAPNSIYKHPSIIAYKLWDEPKTLEKLNKLSNWYRMIDHYYNKPIITAMIGEAMGPPVQHKMLAKKSIDNLENIAWDILDSKILFARHYPYRRQYDLLNWYKEKMKMPYQRWCAYMEDVSQDRQWWYIPQLFGKGKEKSHKSYWRFPTSNELNAMIHTALAYGARGIIGWGMPSFDVKRKPTRKLLLDENLKPEVARDGSIPLEQYGRIGRLVDQHSSLLLSHKKSDLAINNINTEIIAIPRIDPESGDNYIYIVNLNTESANNVDIDLPDLPDITTAQDIYTGTRLQLKKTRGKQWISGNLTPGEARFVLLK